MSLTKFLSIPEVKEKFKLEFNRPRFTAQLELVASPRSNRHQVVGTAFDYLLRFYLQRLNPKAISRSEWVAEQAWIELVHDNDLHAKGEEIVLTAKNLLQEYIETGNLTSQIADSALQLATLDHVFRGGGPGFSPSEFVGVTYPEDIEDLMSLIGAVNPANFLAKSTCVLNPTFGLGSRVVGGADADLVVDNTLIDIKTTKKLSLERAQFDQIIGYYVLHQIGSVGELDPKISIDKVGIYFSRFGFLYTESVSDLINPETFPEFIEWFVERARVEYKSGK